MCKLQIFFLSYTPIISFLPPKNLQTNVQPRVFCIFQLQCQIIHNQE